MSSALVSSTLKRSRAWAGRRRAPGLMLCALLLLALSACGRSSTETTSQTRTPTGNNMPRTAFPMPPTTKPATTTTTTTAAAPSHPAPGTSEQSFTLLDNRRMRLSDYAGQVVVVDFYATWCPPCRAETPHLVQLQRRYGPEGLHIVGLNVGGPDDVNKVPGFIQEFGIQYALGYPDPAMTQLYLSDDDRIPQAFVFDRKGRLAKRFISYDESTPAEMESVIQKALAATD